MAIVDDRGRIAGRVNLVDAAVVFLLFLIIPVAYGAYLLFRTPPAKLSGVTPAQLYQGNNLRVRIDGRDLRPFMRVSFNDVQGRTFLIGSTSSAEVDLPDLAAGTYDVVLYDYQRELDRLPRALTIMPLAPAATVELEVAGAFLGVDAETISELKTGLRFPPSGEPVAEVTSVGRPVSGSVQIRAGVSTFPIPVKSTDVPATVRVRCAVNSNTDGTLGCTATGTQSPAAVVPGSALTLAGPRGWVRFQIAEVHPADRSPVIEARVRFVVTPEQLGLIRAGDVDSGAKGSGASHSASVAAVGPTRTITAAEAGPRAPLGGSLRIVELMLRVPVVRTVDGWVYKEQEVKIGAPFVLETDEYIVRGEVAAITGGLPSTDRSTEAQ